MNKYSKQEYQPVFILSSARSGSTLLRCIIDTHPDFCSPAHLNLGILCNALYSAAYQSLGKLPEVKTIENRELLAIKEARLVVSNLLDRYTQGKGKNAWCEKSTANTDYIDILYNVFPDARYICLYRNCLDVSYSCIKFNPLGYMSELAQYVRNSPDNLVAAMMVNWIDKNKKILEFEESHSDQCFRVNYESLVNEPKIVLEELFNFLGVTWHDNLIDSVFRQSHDQGDGDLKIWFSSVIDKNGIGSGLKIPITVIPKELEIQVNEIHEKLGYPELKNFYYEKDNSLENKNVEEYFNKFLSEKITTNKKKSLFSSGLSNGCCKLLITGSGGGVWLIKSLNNLITIAGSDVSVDCTISTTSKVFYELIERKKDPIQAYELGEIVGNGNMSLALEFGKMLFFDS
jgi:hypothetical protein